MNKVDMNKSFVTTVIHLIEIMLGLESRAAVTACPEGGLLSKTSRLSYKYLYHLTYLPKLITRLANYEDKPKIMLE